MVRRRVHAGAPATDERRGVTTDGINWGPTGELVYNRTYSRTKPDGTRETWPETVARVVDGNLALVPERYRLEGEREDLVRLMTEFKILPAGRHLWASGVKNAQHLFNCWVSGWTEKPSDHFEFTFMRLMEGGGVGANYSNRFLDYGPVKQELFVHIVCDDEHPDYQQMQDAGILSTEYDVDWNGAFQIEDSRGGWAAALVDLIDTHYRDEVTHFQRVYDVSRVRAAGTKLRTFGGRASGPFPLSQMLVEVCSVLSHLAYIGAPMDGISAMEIDHAIAQCVVAGGVRRSARMSMMHWADPQIREFIKCKSESGLHWTTNISVEVDAGFWDDCDKDPKQWLAAEVLQAITEGMVNNGEPGFWDSSLSNVGEPNEVICTNPCQSENTWVQTSNGARKIKDLIGRKFVAIVDGKPYNSISDGFFKTGHKSLYCLDTEEGWTTEVTANHEVYRPDGTRVEVQNLVAGDKIRLSDHRNIVPWEGAGFEELGYALGWLIGDGTFGPHAILQSQGKDVTRRSRRELLKFVAELPHRSDFTGWGGPYTTGQMRLSTKAFSEVAADWGVVKGNKTITDQIEYGSWYLYVGVLRGLFDTGGHIEYSTNAGVSVGLSSSDYDMLIRAQRMLGRMGIRSSVRKLHNTKEMLCPNTGNTYESRPSYRLLITGRPNVIRYRDVIGFWHEEKEAKLNDGIDSYEEASATKFEATFKSLTYLREEDVYDCTIEEVYDFCGDGFYMRDCGEITLEPWEPCNLGHINLAAFVRDTGKIDHLGLITAHKLMTRFLIRATFSDVGDPKSREVLDRNRRIGVGHLGVASFLALTRQKYSEAPSNKRFKTLLRDMAAYVDDAAEAYCHQLRIPVPVKKRTVAPTGTVAKMPGVSEGIHPIFSKYFNRRIRFSEVDPEQRAVAMQYGSDGYDVQPDLYAANTAVVTIPTKDSLLDAVEAIWGRERASEVVEAADDLTLNELLAFQAMYQMLWADNAVSFTANVDPEKYGWSGGGAAYAAEYVSEQLTKFGGLLKGATIFPEMSMPQAPYERITREEYEAADSDAVADGVDEDCANGACPIR